MEQSGTTNDAATVMRTTLAGKLSFTNLWGSAAEPKRDREPGEEDERRDGATDGEVVCHPQSSLPLDEQQSPKENQQQPNCLLLGSSFSCSCFGCT